MLAGARGYDVYRPVSIKPLAVCLAIAKGKLIAKYLTGWAGRITVPSDFQVDDSAGRITSQPLSLCTNSNTFVSKSHLTIARTCILLTPLYVACLLKFTFIVNSILFGRVGLQQGDYKPEGRETQ